MGDDRGLVLEKCDGTCLCGQNLNEQMWFQLIRGLKLQWLDLGSSGDSRFKQLRLRNCYDVEVPLGCVSEALKMFTKILVILANIDLAFTWFWVLFLSVSHMLTYLFNLHNPVRHARKQWYRGGQGPAKGTRLWSGGAHTETQVLLPDLSSL